MDKLDIDNTAEQPLPLHGALESRVPEQLQQHPLNSLLYGEDVDDDLTASIATHGIQTALLITQQNVIISGHRRHAAALSLGLPTVPVVVSNLTDPLDIEEAVISANNGRKKSNYQRAREYQHEKIIQQKLAQQRKLSGIGIVNHRENMPYGPQRKGRARDISAKMLGMSGKTADNALKVVESIDIAIIREHHDHVECMIKRLNKSVIGGHKLAVKLGYITADEKSDVMMSIDNCSFAQWQWIPVTGCAGGCNYCYQYEEASRAPARYVDRSANSDERQSQLDNFFAPRFHPLRLLAPIKTRVKTANSTSAYRVLTCWQGDLFGPGVTAEWIDKVLHTVRESDEKRLPWQFLFLTKNPSRLLEIDWPRNASVGIAVDCQQQVPTAEDTLSDLKKRYSAMETFIRIDPLRELFNFTSLKMCSWLLVDEQKHTSYCDEAQPKWLWWLSLYVQALSDKCGFFSSPTMKLVLPNVEMNIAEVDPKKREVLDAAISLLQSQMDIDRNYMS